MWEFSSEFVINSQILDYWYRSCSFVAKCDFRIDFDTHEYPNIFVSRKRYEQISEYIYIEKINTNKYPNKYLWHIFEHSNIRHTLKQKERCLGYERKNHENSSLLGFWAVNQQRGFLLIAGVQMLRRWYLTSQNFDFILPWRGRLVKLD